MQPFGWGHNLCLDVIKAMMRHRHSNMRRLRIPDRQCRQKNQTRNVSDLPHALTSNHYQSIDTSRSNTKESSSVLSAISLDDNVANTEKQKAG